MKYNSIRKMQRAMGYDTMQRLIDNGHAWMMEGSVGREAMYLLEIGACMLPKKAHTDYYGKTVPSRDWLQNGSKGTFHNSVKFYSNVFDND